MSIVTWQKIYTLGMAEIDEQHKALFDLINQLWEAIAKKVPLESQLLVIEGLERYTVMHFTAEETFMRAINYPKFDEHKKMHDLFIARIAEEKERLRAGKGFSLDVLYFLKDWLVNHILVSDQQYAHFSQSVMQTQLSLIGRFFKSFFGKS